MYEHGQEGEGIITSFSSPCIHQQRYEPQLIVHYSFNNGWLFVGSRDQKHSLVAGPIIGLGIVFYGIWFSCVVKGGPFLQLGSLISQFYSKIISFFCCLERFVKKISFFMIHFLQLNKIVLVYSTTYKV
jgi:hypothetical protein